MLNKNTVTSALTWDEVVHHTRKQIGKEEAIKTAKGFLNSHTIILPVSKETLQIANDFFPTLNPRDSIHLACMKQHGLKTIATKDNDFKKIKGIKVI
jgi:predicted nucleic acid-binding protein